MPPSPFSLCLMFSRIRKTIQIMHLRSTALSVCVAMIGAPAHADQVFMWQQGSPTKQLVGAADNFCYLTRVSGKFRGYGERVRLRVINAKWELGGQSQQIDVSAWARCIGRTEIKANSDAVRWASEEISATADNPGSGCVDTNPRNAWWGDAVTVTTLVTGSLRGGGERLTINQSGDPFGASTLVLHSCQKQLGLGVYSFFVGKPQSGHIAKFIGPNGIGTAGQAGEYKSIPNQNVIMAATSSAICYFSEIGGEFNGGGENLTILPGSDANGASRWILQARHQSGTGVFAKARCYAKDQR